jgi:Amt family ammonium transporter
MFIWHLCVYTPIAHITWNHGGFFYTNTIEDFSGGLVVHMTAGITAVTAHLFLDWIQAPKSEARRPTDPENLVLAAVGVWFLWFGINAGKAYAADGVAAQSMVNTIAGVTTSVIGGYFLDLLLGYAYSDVSVVNSILIGLIATTPCSGLVTVGGSMVVTVITMLTVRIIGKYIFKEARDDTPYSIGVLHGIGGSTAFLFTAMMSYEMVNPADANNGLTWGHDTPIRHHTAAVLAMWACGFCALLLTLAVSNLVVPLSKTKQSPNGDYAPTPLGPFGAADNEKHAPEPVQNA